MSLTYRREKIQVRILEYNSNSGKCIETMIRSRVDMNTDEKHFSQKRTTSIKSTKSYCDRTGQGKARQKRMIRKEGRKKERK